MTAEQIKSVNEFKDRKWDSWDQGIFTEPNWIPNDIKEPVIYMRWETGGISGGSCWDSSDPQPYTRDEEKPLFLVLDHVLSILKPDLTYLQYREIENTLVHTNNETDWEYYGNCTDYEVSYVILSQLEKFLEKL